MARAAKPAPKHGPLSGTQRSPIMAQEVAVPRSHARLLEIRRTTGEVLHTHPLPETSGGHQVTPDGRLIYVLTGGKVTPNGLVRQLVALETGSGAERGLGPAANAEPAVDDTRIAFFRDDRLIVADHDGTILLDQPVGLPANRHASAACGIALLPGDRVAYARGHRHEDKIADLTVLDGVGKVLQSLELPAETFYAGFSIAGLAADAEGTRVAILGYHAGLLVVDLASGEDIANRFEAHPLALAEGRPTRHANHTYRGIAFDRAGRLAAAYRPGNLTLWDRDGTVLRREEIAVNPKAGQLVTFDDEGIAFFDTYGATARFAL